MEELNVLCSHCQIDRPQIEWIDSRSSYMTLDKKGWAIWHYNKIIFWCRYWFQFWFHFQGNWCYLLTNCTSYRTFTLCTVTIGLWRAPWRSHWRGRALPSTKIVVVLTFCLMAAVCSYISIHHDLLTLHIVLVGLRNLVIHVLANPTNGKNEMQIYNGKGWVPLTSSDNRCLSYSWEVVNINEMNGVWLMSILTIMPLEERKRHAQT